MPQCVVIADDLTGANATGVLLKKMNYKAYTVMNTERIELSTLSDCDCVYKILLIFLPFLIR